MKGRFVKWFCAYLSDRMEDQPRSSYRHLLLQAWCCLLTVAMVIMAVHLATMNQKPAEVSMPATNTDFTEIHVDC